MPYRSKTDVHFLSNEEIPACLQSLVIVQQSNQLCSWRRIVFGLQIFPFILKRINCLSRCFRHFSFKKKEENENDVVIHNIVSSTKNSSEIISVLSEYHLIQLGDLEEKSMKIFFA